ncbi:ferredoxin [Streptomyces xantholiticus]|uniref:Ferredoxin n=2 Tax=Streptomyces TaxID=1883 RepID=B3VA40_STRC0|nr:putative ferredoxin [Streptomyces peucetius subsp. caesius ATCC 27952]ATW51256.1 ferredoxin [Streptomyces peucetius subsp. caesius ATCC 27952]
MRIETDKDLCCGAGTCVLAAPAVFDQNDEDGTVILLDATPGAEQRAAVKEAAERCPTAAIRIA